MKKILTILIIMLIMPLSLTANSSAPKVERYDAVVNVNSPQLYTFDFEKIDEKISYGEIIEIDYERVYKGEIYGFFFIKGVRERAINLKDIKPVNEEIQPGERRVYKGKVMVVFEGLRLHSGPANAYKTVTGMVKAGTVLEYNHVSGDEAPAWAYTEYEGKKGWVEIYSESDQHGYIATESFSSKIITVDSFKMYRQPDIGDGAVFIREVPGYKKITVNYEYYYYEGADEDRTGYRWLNVTYNGISGWIEDYKWTYVGDETKYTDNQLHAYECDEKFITFADVKLYDYPSIIGQKSVGVMKSGYEGVSTYCYEERGNNILWYYVTYNDKNYWISSESFVGAECDTKFITIEDVKLYDYPSKNGVKSLGNMKSGYKGVSLYCYYDRTDYLSWYYVAYNEKNYWINDYQFLGVDDYVDEDDDYFYDYDSNPRFCDYKIDITMYKYPSLNSEFITEIIIPANTVIERQYIYNNGEDGKNWNYISYNGFEGWVFEEEDSYECSDSNLWVLFETATAAVEQAEKTRSLSDYQNAEKLVEELPAISEKTILRERLDAIDVIKEEKTSDGKIISNLFDKMPSKIIIYFSLAGAVVLGSIAIILLKVVNKNRKAIQEKKDDI